jgi:hypothetical protein
MNLLANLFRRQVSRSARKGAARFQPRLDVLEDRTVQSATPAGSAAALIVPVSTASPSVSQIVLWSYQNLQNAGVRNAVINDYQADGRLTYADMVAVFEKVARDSFVTRAEMNDLQTIVANPLELGLTPVIDNLASKVVSANSSNATFQDQSLPTSDIVNGQLQTGATGATLEELIDKWFLGQDHPDLATSGATQYKAVKGTLFGPTGPQGTDVQQGWVADCYFMSPLAATADKDPQAIKDMFIDEGVVNGHQVYAVRFFNNGQADYVTVDNQLPAAHVGGQWQLTAAGYGEPINNPNTVLWVSLAEKAYAQLTAEGWNRSYDGFFANSYNSLNYGWACYSLEQIKGLASTTLWIGQTGTKARLIQDINAGKLIALASDAPASGSLPYGVLSNHYYAVVGYHHNAKGQVVFDLLNPYADGGSDGARVLHLTWSELKATFSDWETVAP